nr:glycine receptor subunit alpha-2-like [Parasteatoda tepidariorum]
MTFYWYDSRLMTPECRDEKKDCDDSFDLKKRFDELWTPDLYILNSRLARQHDQPLRNGMVYLHATGRVLLSKRLSVTLRCPMNLIHYPLDTQKCPLLICPYSLTEEELILRWSKNGVGILDHEDDGQHKFILQRPVRFGSWKLSYEGPDVSGSFSCVNATFTLKRNNGYHIGYSYSITGFIVIVSWLAFWLPVNAIPARVTLGVTTLLTLLTTANFVRTSLPPIPYVTAIDVWVGVCTLFVLLALLLFPIAHHFSTKSMEKTDQKGTKIMVHSRIDPLNLKCIKCGGNKSASNALSSKESLNVDKLCKQLFPVLFFVFNTIYWWYYLTQN